MTTLDLSGSQLKATVNTGTITAGRFVAAVISDGDVQVVQAGLGDRVFGVSQDDGDANVKSKSRIAIDRPTHGLTQVTAGGTLAVDALVMSDADGKAVTHDGDSAHAVAGRVIAGGSSGAPVLIDAAGTGGGTSSGGGSSPGAAVVRAFPFTFDTPNLVTGAAIYTPTAGDVLVNAWVEITTAFDGTAPRGDFGMFDGDFGWMSSTIGYPVDMTAEDSSWALGDAGTLTGSQAAAQPSDLQHASYTAGSVGGGTYFPGRRIVPLKLTAATPIKVVVSQDGTAAGADPGAAQGAAVLYLVTATPA